MAAAWPDNKRREIDRFLVDLMYMFPYEDNVEDAVDEFLRHFSGSMRLVERIYAGGIHCFEYALGARWPLTYKEIKKTLAKLPETSEPEKGDFVLYMDRKDSRPTHIATYAGNNLAVSKWGIWPVVKNLCLHRSIDRWHHCILLPTKFFTPRTTSPRLVVSLV